jgi:hypothetical protein
MNNSQKTRSLINKFIQNLPNTLTIGFDDRQSQLSSHQDYSHLDGYLSNLFDSDPFHEILQEWIVLCNLHNLQDDDEIQHLCLKLCNGYNQIGNLAYESSDVEVALECYQVALTLCPSKWNVMRSQILFNRGIVFIKIQDLDLALKEFEAAIASNNQFKKAYYQRDRILYQINTPSQNYRFTHDWFSRNIPLLLEYLQDMIGKPDLQFLEIGSWEGRSTCWFLDKILTHESSQITCIDTFAGEAYLNLKQNVLENVESRFSWNIEQTGANTKVKKYVGESQNILRYLPLNTYDVIYIDGCHLAIDVLSDAVISWGLLKKGGLMIFDDYDKVFPENPSQNTSIAIDAFVKCFNPAIKMLHQSHQVYCQKS